MFHLGAHPADRRLLRSRLYLLGLALAFLGPLLAAALVYTHPELRAGLGGGSHGEMILPPRPLERAWFRAAGEAPRWTLLYRAQAPACSLECEALLFMARQARASLGARRARARVLVWLEREEYRAGYAAALRRLPPDAARALPADFDPAPFADRPRDALFLVDPLGNLLMQYGGETTSRGLLRDLKRLLAASRIG